MGVGLLRMAYGGEQADDKEGVGVPLLEDAVAVAASMNSTKVRRGMRETVMLPHHPCLRPHSLDTQSVSARR